MRRDYGEMWRRYKLEADADAREALILAYTPLVKHVVDRMNISPMSYMDYDDLLTHASSGSLTPSRSATTTGTRSSRHTRACASGER